MARARIELEESAEDALWDYWLYVSDSLVHSSGGYTTENNAINAAKFTLEDWQGYHE